MFGKLLRRLFGTRNDRLLKRYRKVVAHINALEAELLTLDDAALRGRMDDFRARAEAGVSLDDLLPGVFAVVREASQRVLGMRHFDVQLMGGMVLHEGCVAEMRTGEGKTLTSTLAVVLNALTGQGVHLVTVNDYLASRDAEWMRPLYTFLGVSVGVNLHSMDLDEKQAAYACDVTYGTNNEFGFDYLRDNMVFELGHKVQRKLNYAIIDEVDSILIDEARTPLIISGAAEQSSTLYAQITKLIPKLKKQDKEDDPLAEEPMPEEEQGDYTVDEKQKQVSLTDRGHASLEHLLSDAGLLESGTSLYDYQNVSMMHYALACLRAYALYQRDVDYLVQGSDVVIIDEHTGRTMEGRRWSDGLHQAIEAKEGVKIQVENQTLATVTLQNFFRQYQKLSGMTGTADTEAFELHKIYGLEVVVVPTNKPMIRDDRADKVYLTMAQKYKEVVKEIQECQSREQPVLVGTASVESSELLSALLRKEKIKHEVLNAKQHEREAHIVAEAGKPGAVTISTNMAGRGTDIVLGGNLEAEIAALDNPSEAVQAQLKADWKVRHDKVIEAGGLFVLGTERHESRRIDNQLRGRSGRQGDPGVSQFYLSMEDNLLRIFLSERVRGFLMKIGVKEEDVIQHKWISNSIEKAQRRVEGANFDIRKSLLEYDDVANDQRKVIYDQRQKLLEKESITDVIDKMRVQVIEGLIEDYAPEQAMEEQWDVVGLEKKLDTDFDVKLPIASWLEAPAFDHAALVDQVQAAVAAHYHQKQGEVDAVQLQAVEKMLALQLLDHYWKEHLGAMEQLRQSIHLQSYAQKNPAQEYKRGCFSLFTNMLQTIKFEIVANLCRLKVEQAASESSGSDMTMQYQHADLPALAEEGTGPEKQTPISRQGEKVGRNDPCPCGSGKKYKQCHGQL